MEDIVQTCEICTHYVKCNAYLSDMFESRQDFL